MTLEELALRFGGWLGFLVYFLYKEAWPVVANKWIPSKIKSAEQHQSVREQELLSDKAFRRDMEKMQQEISMKVADAVQSLATSMAVTNERMASIKADQVLILSRQEATFSVLTDVSGELRALTRADDILSRNRRKDDPK